MAPADGHSLDTLNPAKFRDPAVTADGKTRATVALTALRTLWFNTGTLCNLTCRNCYIESSPTNDRLAYLTAGEVRSFLDEIERDTLATAEIGFTGGEPFMNPQFMDMLGECLTRGFKAIVLTNAMKPMMKVSEDLRRLGATYGEQLTIRVSLDHYSKSVHEAERGPRSWDAVVAGIDWLSANGFNVHLAGRTFSGEDEAACRAGYAALIDGKGWRINAHDPAQVVLFPEMDAGIDVPEITTACWGILKKSPDSVMCASSRMVVRHKDATAPSVVACTLLPYDPQFDLGGTLREAARSVPLNHPHCARFCVLGGASCSQG